MLSQVVEGFNLFEERIAGALPELERGTVALVAVSGGADSTSLLVALSRLRGRFGYELRCVYVDHGIRSERECREDREAVASLCGDLGVPFVSVGPPSRPLVDRARSTGRGIEDAARCYRRRALRSVARREGATLIFLGHTLDDVLETVLMRVLRGSGPAGLAGIPGRRGPFLRPMLGLGRAEVLAYLGGYGVSFRTDSTNSDTSILRNRIRSRLVPLLDAEFPGWRPGLQGFSAIQGRVSSALAEAARRGIRWAWTSPDRRALGTASPRFFAAPQFIREEALFRAADRLARCPRDRGLEAGSPGRREPARAAVALFCSGAATSVDLGPVCVRLESGRVIVSPVQGRGESGASLAILRPGDFEFRGLRFRVGEPPGLLSVALPCVVRSPLPADEVTTVAGRRLDLRRLCAGRGTEALATVEDGGGIVAVILRSGGSDIVRIEINRKESETYYARRVFFSIL